MAAGCCVEGGWCCGPITAFARLPTRSAVPKRAQAWQPPPALLCQAGAGVVGPGGQAAQVCCCPPAQAPPPPRAGPQVQHPPWQQLPRRPPGISHAAWLTTDAGTQVCAVPRRGAAKHERPLPDGGAAGNKVSRLRPAPTSTARAAMRAPPPGHARLPARLCPAPAVRSTHSCSSGHLVGVRPLALPARARCRRPAGSATPCSWTGAWWADRCAG